MSSTHENPPPRVTNPLQTNNTALMIVGYVAGIIAVKFPIFDLATWNYIILTAGGLVFTISTVLVNRKSKVVATVADMAEVNHIVLDKTVEGSGELNKVTPNNVVVK